jgi:RNA polymerase sigma-70 factor (ECF subfamily)
MMHGARYEPSDSQLCAKAVGGDTEAFSLLVSRHQRRIWMICRQYVGPEEADGAAQETFVKAYRKLGTFDGRAKLTTWLTRIAINTCVDRLRQRGRLGRRVEVEDDADTDPLEQIVDQAADPERRAIQRQAVRRLEVCEAGLPERQREVFRLRFYAGLELDEIARALGVHVGTVKTQLHRAVHRVRAELGDVT